MLSPWCLSSYHTGCFCVLRHGASIAVWLTSTPAFLWMVLHLFVMCNREVWPTPQVNVGFVRAQHSHWQLWYLHIKGLPHFRAWMTLHWIMKSFYPHVLSVSSRFYSLINTHGARCWGIPGAFPPGYSSHSVSVDYSQHQRLCHICDHCGGFYACVWNDECIEALGLSEGVAPVGPHATT